MTTAAKEVYVISDLHLGGHGDGVRIFHQGDRLAEFIGERTRDARAKSHDVELVINGDFVDFLAEPTLDGKFLAFRHDPEEAKRAFEKIVAGERAVFAALKEFLEHGGHLTLLLGNHDLELSLPNVREALEEEIGAAGRNFKFLYDGEAYVVGDVLIEHGNQYDEANRTNYDRLREFRAHLSKRLEVADGLFTPPVGASIMAEVVGPISRTPGCDFIAKMKPERSRAFVRLVRLFSEDRVLHASAFIREWISGPLLRIKERTQDLFRKKKMAVGLATTDSAHAPIDAADEPEDIMEYLLHDLTEDEQEIYRASVDGTPEPSSGVKRVPMASAASRRWDILSSNDPFSPENRRLLADVRRLATDASFSESIEKDVAFMRQFEALTRPGEGQLAGAPFQVVIFGHSHFKKRVTDKETGATYYNSGTWADLMRFSRTIIRDPDHKALPELDRFLKDIASGNETPLRFQPYVRLLFDDAGKLVEHALEDPSDDARRGNTGDHS